MKRTTSTSSTTIDQVERWRERLQSCFGNLIKSIGSIQIGSPKQFPFGWRKAAKGRTVWRIIEELLSQNLAQQAKRSGFTFEASESEVSVWDARMKFDGEGEYLYVNFKSAVADGQARKDDISKADGLLNFYGEDEQRPLFLATLLIEFHADMTLNLKDCVVMPIAWLPDIYVNPSNNGNLQSAYYRDLPAAHRRTNKAFVKELTRAWRSARKKRTAKALRGATKHKGGPTRRGKRP